MRLEELFEALHHARAKYLLIGGLASILHGVPRTTVDIDIAVATSPKNLQRVITTLKNLGLTADTEHVDDILAQGGITFRNDREVDVLTSLPGDADFGKFWSRRDKVAYHGVTIDVISKGDQIQLLRRVGRPKDLEDVELLEQP
ncbi:MAG: hypothetical protein KGI98_16210 [Euryarchaeota archaeon]|nr:hypothetical protein [Euryarchaeota archaeon]